MAKTKEEHYKGAEIYFERTIHIHQGVKYRLVLAYVKTTLVGVGKNKQAALLNAKNAIDKYGNDEKVLFSKLTRTNHYNWGY